MSGTNLSLAMAFLAGLASFFSPCILPLAPGYISILSGVKIDDGYERGKKILQILLPTFLFVLGFSIVFIIMGSTVTALGAFLVRRRQMLNHVSGVIIIIFGLHMSGIIPIKLLYQVVKPKIELTGERSLRSFVTGVAFALGWTPCIGPILGSILIVAGNSTQAWQGLFLLSAYAAGVALPFLLLSIGFAFGITLFQNWGKISATVEKITGLALIPLGLLLFFGRLNELTSFFSNS